MKEMTFSQSRKTKPIQTQNKPNLETTLIGISPAPRYLANASISETKKAIGHFARSMTYGLY